MTYDLRDQQQYMQALDFIELAKQNNWYVTLEKKRVTRTTQQNKYYWLILKYFGLQYGCTKTEAEYYFKQIVNPDIFLRTYTDKHNIKIKTIRSTSELSKDEMISAINNFIVYCDQNRIHIPRPDDKEMIRYTELEVERGLSWT